MLAGFATAWLIHLLAAASPGPAVLLTARTAMSHGMRPAVPLALGIGAGAVSWAAAALLGLGVLFEHAPALLQGLRIAGAAYIAWIAVQMWREADRPLDAGETADAAPGRRAAFRRGLLTQYANPKAAVFFSAVFLGTLPPEAPAWALALFLVAVLVNEVGWNILIARVFSFDRTRRGYISLRSVIDRIFGGLLGALALKLAAAQE